MQDAIQSGVGYGRGTATSVFLAPSKGTCCLFQGAVFMSGLVTRFSLAPEMPCQAPADTGPGLDLALCLPREKKGHPSTLKGIGVHQKTLSPDSSMSSDEQAGSLMSRLGPGAKSLTTLLAGGSHPIAMRMAHFKTEQRAQGKVTMVLASVSAFSTPKDPY